MGERIEVDRDEWEATQDRLRAVEERLARLDAPEAAPPAVVEAPAPDHAGATSRRKALIGMAGAAAGAAALVAGQASPAAANGQGQSWTLGDPTNTASATTGVTATLAGTPALSVRNSSLQRAILGVAGSPSGNGGTAAIVGDAASTDGVFGLSGTGRGVAAISTSGAAIAALSVNGTGLEVTAGATGIEVTADSNGIEVTADGAAPDFGIDLVAAVVAQSGSRSAVIALSGFDDAVTAQSQTGVGVAGRSQSDYGLYGFSGSEAGVRGLSNGDVGVLGTGPGGGVTGTSSTASEVLAPGVSGYSQFSYGVSAGGRVPLHLVPSPMGNTLPTGRVGNVWVANNGTQWVCVAADKWRVVAGSATAGALHVLPTPARVYDSRPGTAPTAVGPKTKFARNETRTLDLKANGSGVPEGATAALLTILLVNASTTAGNATVWANGRAKPLANTMVWGGAAGRFTATATTAVDDFAKVWFNASQPTDLVLDVVGYYR